MWLKSNSPVLNKTIATLLVIALIPCLTYKLAQADENGAINAEKERFFGSLVFDKNGVPYYNYSYTGHTSIGLQGNPHAVITQALIHYKDYLKTSNESSKNYFVNNVNWLASTNMLKKDESFSAYEYPFPWKVGDYEIKSNWRNAMANGEALNPLVKAYRITDNKTYLDVAKSLLNSFYVEVKDGGVAYKSPSSGWWYEEYAVRDSTKQLRVLNGMIHAIFGINEYYKYTKDASAKFILDQGILALKNDLPHYDMNGTSYYDRLGLPANDFYKSLHVIQLSELYNLTGEAIFKTYHDKWDEYNKLEKAQTDTSNTVSNSS